MCKWGTDRIIHVIRRNNDNIPDGWHAIAVDACIADYVQEMNNKGIITLGCCCSHGHGKPIVQIDTISIGALTQHGYAFRVETYTYGDENGNPYQQDVIEHDIPLDALKDIT